MEANGQFLDGGGPFWNAGYGSIRPNDANVDPMLTPITTTNAAIASDIVWDPDMGQPMDVFDANVHGALMPGTMPAKTPTNSRDGTRSATRTLSAQSDPVISPTDSKYSLPSSSWTPLEHAQNSRASEVQALRHRPARRRYTSPSVVEYPQPIATPSTPRSDEIEVKEDDEAKRDEFLKRNRLAASRCRKKKKEWVNNLEETKFGLEQRNASLRMEYKGLLDEVSQMKHQLMIHATCKDPNIDMWIENEARKVVEKSRQQFHNDRFCNSGQRNLGHHRKSARTHSRANSARSPGVGANYNRPHDEIFESAP